jgi:alanyl-tRNA synthetase
MNSEVMQKNHRILQEDPSLPSAATGVAESTEESPHEETNASSSALWSIKIPDHVCVLEKFHMWIPLDRAVFVTRAVLHFLSEKHMAIILKHIESMAMFLSSQGVLEEPDGNHTVIRAVMRRFQEMTTEGGTNAQHIPAVDAKTIVVNMEKLLQA